MEISGANMYILGANMDM